MESGLLCSFIFGRRHAGATEHDKVMIWMIDREPCIGLSTSAEAIEGIAAILLNRLHALVEFRERLHADGAEDGGFVLEVQLDGSRSATDGFGDSPHADAGIALRDE